MAALASLRYRSGGWDLRYRERSGKERTERFRGESAKRPPPAALERKGTVEAQLIRGTFVSRDLRERPFRSYYERWDATRQISASWRYTDDQRAAEHVLPYWGDWAICDIRPSDIDDWIGLLSRRMGPVSVRHCYALLRGPLRRAIKDRVIDNPCIDIALPKLPDIRKTFDDVLTAAETERLVEAVADPDPRYARLRTNGRYKALVFMGCWLGPRWNEAIGLRVCDINPLRKELTFGRVVVNQNGTTTFTEEMSKTDDAHAVPVPIPVMEALLDHLRIYRPDTAREDFLFLSNRDTHPLRGTFCRDVLAKSVKRAGLTGRRVTWLTLRLTAASLMFDAGLTLFEVQQRLGHRSPTLTAQVYTHLMRERFEEGREKLGRDRRLECGTYPGEPLPTARAAVRPHALGIRQYARYLLARDLTQATAVTPFRG